MLTLYFAEGRDFNRFWVRALEKLNPTLGAQEWFINQWDKWTTSVVVVANNRSTRRICGIDEYLKMRRINLATGIAYATINFTLGLDKDILDHCSIVKLLDHASDMICLCNVRSSCTQETNLLLCSQCTKYRTCTRTTSSNHAATA